MEERILGFVMLVYQGFSDEKRMNVLEIDIHRYLVDWAFPVGYSPDPVEGSGVGSLNSNNVNPIIRDQRPDPVVLSVIEPRVDA